MLNKTKNLISTYSENEVFKRRQADSNRCTSFCRALPSHSATTPFLRGYKFKYFNIARNKNDEYYRFLDILIVTMATLPPIGGFSLETSTVTFLTKGISSKIRSRTLSATVSNNLVR